MGVDHYLLENGRHQGNHHSFGYSLRDSSRAYHASLVWDGRILRYFVNGTRSSRVNGSFAPEEIEVLEWSANKDHPLSAFSLGAGLSLSERGKQSYHFHGIIDEVRISDIARYSEDFTPEARFETDEHTTALYHFDEGQGDVLIDSSGNGHHGQIQGAQWVKVDEELNVIGRISPEPMENYALEFDDSFVGPIEIASFEYDGIRPVMVELLARRTGSRSGPAHAIVIALGPSAISSNRNVEKTWLWSLAEDRQGIRYVWPLSDTPTGKADHIAGVYDGDSLRLYVNGVCEQETVFEDDPSTHSSTRLFLNSPLMDPELRFLGIIDEVRISDVARYTKDFTPMHRFKPDTHTLALYHFDEGQGDVFIDSSGNGHHGQIHGAQ